MTPPPRPRPFAAGHLYGPPDLREPFGYEPAGPPADQDRRRSLTHVGGATWTAGDPEAAAALAHALAVRPATDAEGDPARSHVHGFHTYPARMHPATAARLVRAFCPPGARLLDPFCGSGTVLVEALALGRRPAGTDLNPLAVLLSRRKARPRGPKNLAHLVDRAGAVATHADERRTGRAGATRRLPAEDVALFEPHVLLELDSLRAGIEAERDDPAEPDLWLVLSAVLVKLSRRKADTSAATAVRRTAAGFAARLFVQKAEEFAARLAAYRALLPEPPPPPALVEPDDATHLWSVPSASADAVVTSPPYAATYDYLAHHDLRMRWLGLDPTPLADGELGGRAAYQRVRPADAPAVWADEFARFLTAAWRVVVPGGAVALVLADSAVGAVALRADEIVADLARDCGFAPVAVASQPRPHFHGPTAAAFRDRPRAEHAILLRKL